VAKRAIAGTILLIIGGLMKVLISARFLALFGIMALEDTFAMWIGSELGIGISSLLLVFGFALIAWFVGEKVLKNKKAHKNKFFKPVLLLVGVIIGILIIGLAQFSFPLTTQSTVVSAVTGTPLIEGEPLLEGIPIWTIGTTLIIIAMLSALVFPNHKLVKAFNWIPGIIAGTGISLLVNQAPQLIGGI